jgi:DNA-binding LacI/PurR family transcriptional regulator
VSVSTASLAYSGAGPVSAATRERVLAAAAELGYGGPDPLARSLRRGRSGVVGVIIADRLRNAFRDPVAVALLDGLADELAPLQASLLLLSGDSTQPGPSLEQVARVPLDAAVFVTCGRDDDPLLQPLAARGVPVVAVEGPSTSFAARVEIDDRRGTSELVRHLLDLGHARDRIAVVALPAHLGEARGLVSADELRRGQSAVVRRRIAGVVDALGREPALVVEAGNQPADGARALEALLAADPRPTAVVAQSDLLAAGVLRAARAAGVAVPGDLSVAGFDGVELAELGDTVLTTVEQPLLEKGRMTGRAVAALLAGERPDDVLLPVRLRLGTTTGPPPGASPSA